MLSYFPEKVNSKIIPIAYPFIEELTLKALGKHFIHLVSSHINWFLQLWNFHNYGIVKMQDYAWCGFDWNQNSWPKFFFKIITIAFDYFLITLPHYSSPAFKHILWGLLKPYAGTQLHLHPSKLGVNQKLSEAGITHAFDSLRHDAKGLKIVRHLHHPSDPL